MVAKTASDDRARRTCTPGSRALRERTITGYGAGMRALDSLAPWEQDLLEALAAWHFPVDPGRFLVILRLLGVQDASGADYELSSLSLVVHSLASKGWTGTVKGRIACAIEQRDMLAISALKSGMLARVVALAAPSEGEPFGQTTKEVISEGLLRELRYRIMAGQVEQADGIVRELRRRFAVKGKMSDPVLTVFRHPSAELVSTLPGRFQAPIVRDVGYEALDYLQDTDPFTQWLGRVTRAAGGDAAPELLHAFAELLLLRGFFEQAGEIIRARPDDPEFMALDAWVRLLRGDAAKAVEVFSRADVKGAAWPTGFAGAMFVIALLKAGPATWSQARVRAQRAAKATDPIGMAAIFDTLRLAADGMQNQNGEAWEELARASDALLGQGDREVRCPDLWVCLGLWWTGSGPDESTMKLLAQFGRDARRGGWLWLTYEADELAARLLERDPDERAEEFRRAHGLVPLADVVTLREPWQEALDALTACAAPAAVVVLPRASHARVAWSVTIGRGWASISALEQRASGKSGWTKGRPIALKRLRDSGKELEYATEADRRVFSRIRRRTYRDYGHLKEEFHLDAHAALCELAGHEAVFLETDDGTRVPAEVRLARPGLAVDESSGGLRITVAPPEREWDRVHHDGGSGLTVYAVTPAARRIAEIVGEGIDVPSEGLERAIAALSAVAGTMEVDTQLDIAPTSAERLDPDRRVRLRLRRRGAGLVVRAVITPLGASGPAFLPGEGRSAVSADIGGRTVRTRRDLDAERREWIAIRQALPAFDALEPSDEGWLAPDLTSSLYLLSDLGELGDRIAVEWPQGASLRATRPVSAKDLRLRLRSADQWFEADGELKVNEALVLEFRRLLELAAGHPGPFIELAPDEFLVLTEDFRRRLDAWLAWGSSHAGVWRLHPAAAAVGPDLGEGLGAFEADAKWKRLAKNAAQAAEQDPPIPSDLQAALRDYQVDGFRWLARMARWGLGACLADDMGLGKTIQVLAVALVLGRQGPVLVIAPTSVCPGWIDEIQRFTPSLRPVLFGPGDRSACLADASAGDVVVCSYGLLLQEKEALTSRPWQMVVLDEAQAVKNAKSQRAQAVRQLKAGFRVATTGTPIENHIDELWSLFRFLVPGLLGTQKEFGAKYGAATETGPAARGARALKAVLRPFILRRTKSQVLQELPPRTDITRRAALSAEEASGYDLVRRDALRAVSRARSPGKQSAIDLLAQLTRLRRAACHMRFAVPGAPLASAKLEVLGEILDDLRDNGHRALVFSQFVDHLDIVREFVEGRGVRYQYLDGSTPMAKRADVVRAWQAGDGEAFLISLKAGGFGLNLTGADYVVHMDPWWNPAVEDQASDRAHRMGQQRPLTVYRIVAEGTIEERILDLHSRKRELAERLLEGGDGLARLSAEQLLGLLRELA